MPTHRYTEHQFRTAVNDPDVRTMADLCRALGIVPRGANYETVRAFGLRLNLDIDRSLMLHWLTVNEDMLMTAVAGVTSMGELLRRLGIADLSGNRRRLRLLLGDAAPDASPLPLGDDGRRAPRSYTDEQLLDALATARNYGELCALLGLRSLSATRRRLREHAERLGAPIHAAWSRPGSVGPDGVKRRSRHPGERETPLSGFDPHELRAAVTDATSIAEALRTLGHRPTDTTRRWFARDVRRHDVDISHFPPVGSRGGRSRRPIEDMLVQGRNAGSTDLRRRLLKEGLKHARCEWCLQTRWHRQPIPLELDHIAGGRTNNLLENLRLLCPNCHALTPTYRGRNIGRRPATTKSAVLQDDDVEEP
jgi:hypothetical protein